LLIKIFYTGIIARFAVQTSIPTRTGTFPFIDKGFEKAVHFNKIGKHYCEFELFYET